MVNKKRLKEKGWDDKEVNHVDKIYKKSEIFAKRNQIITYWLSVLVMIFVILLLSLWFVPLFMFFEHPLVYVVIALVGLSFGTMFNNLVIHLEHVENKHHIFVAIIIPVISAMALYLSVKGSAYVAALLNSPIRQNPFDIGLAFIVPFLIPYVYGIIYQRNKYV